MPLTRNLFEFIPARDNLGPFFSRGNAVRRGGDCCWQATATNALFFGFQERCSSFLICRINSPPPVKPKKEKEKEREREREREIERGGREREGQKYLRGAKLSRYESPVPNVMNFEVTMMFYYRNTAVPARSQMPKPRIVELVWCRPI